MPKERNKAMELGDYCHGKLDIYYQLLRQTQDPEELLDALQTNILEDILEDGSNGEIVSRCIQMMTRYIREHSPGVDVDIEIIESEMHFEAPLRTPKGRDFILEGYVDLLYSIGGQIRVRDHKTTGKPNNFRKQGVTEYDQQQPTYIGGLRTVGIPVFRGEVNELITYPYKNYMQEPIDKLMRVTPTYRTDLQIQAAMDWYGQVVDQMIEEQVFLRSLDPGCRYCNFREPCLMSQQGIDDGPILDLAFKKKDGWSEYHANTPRP